MSERGERPQAAIPVREARDALDRVLRSDALRASKRLRRLLAYSVDAALDGRSDDLNQYAIGIEVFDKPESFDPAVDPIVRVEAGRLRRRLELYYSDEGAEDPVRLRFAGRGYATRFERRADESARRSAQTRQSATRRPPGSRRSDRLSLVVLPFIDLSPRRDQDFFCEGVTAELISRLATVDTIRVLSHSVAHQLGGGAVDVIEVGRRFGADAVLEGSVRRYAAESRITAQLSDAADGFLLWAGAYDSNGDRRPLEAQQEVVDSIHTALTVALGGRNVARL